jgi:hypothetical protein
MAVRGDLEVLPQVWVGDIGRGVRYPSGTRPLLLRAGAEARPRVRDTRPAMAEESMARDLVELTRQAIDASNRGDYDAVMRLFAPDVVWESRSGRGS